MKFLAGIIFTFVLLIIAGLLIIYSGWYNVSALKPESGVTKWILNTTMDNSVEYHSKDIVVPELNDPKKISEGLAHYKEMCETCHEGPGMEESELAKGLNPNAPNLVKHGKNMDAKEIFWITKNGIKMTGMPAWGDTHSDEKIWAITAAVKKLYEITPNEYKSISTDKNEMETSKASEVKLRYQ